MRTVLYDRNTKSKGENEMQINWQITTIEKKEIISKKRFKITKIIHRETEFKIQR